MIDLHDYTDLTTHRPRGEMLDIIPELLWLRTDGRRLWLCDLNSDGAPLDDVSPAAVSAQIAEWVAAVEGQCDRYQRDVEGDSV